MLSVNQAFEKWLANRPDLAEYRDRGKPYPVYIVAAEGGGSYAAHHTAMVLAELQDRCPRFRHHVFAISGVSGGSLGAAVFASVADRLEAQPYKVNCPGRTERPKWINEADPIALWKPEPVRFQPCIAQSLGIRTTPNTDASEVPTLARDATCRFLARDFLSPVVFLAIVPNIAQRVLSWLPSWIPRPRYDRALGLEYGFEAAATDLPEGRALDSYFERSVIEAWSPEKSVPALVLNMTRADSGERYLAAPFRFAPLTQ